MSSDEGRPIAVITGAARGVGAATARRFQQAGHNVILLDIDESGEAVAEEIGGTFIKHDVSNPDHWATLEANIKGRPGHLQALVNNAAIEGRHTFETMPLEDWQRTIDINLTGPFLGSQFAARLMRDNPKDCAGAIVNVASIAAHVSIAMDAPYTASKGGLISLTKSVAHYCGINSWPIRCNVISPGAIKTEMLVQYIASSQDPAATEAGLNNLQPIGHMATPSNIANLIYYLTTDQSEFITGAEVVIDGGALSAANV